MPPGAIPERIWKTDDLQRLDDLLSAANGRRTAERTQYLDELKALDDPAALQALKATGKYPDPWPNVIGPDLAITRWFGVYGDPSSSDAFLTEQHMRNDWYTDKSTGQDPQTGQRGWWSHNKLSVADLLRQAVIQAGTLAIQKPGLPVDSYWISAGSDTGDGYTATPFQCFVTWNPRQIMLFILTPAVPTGYQFAAPKQAERSTLQIAVPVSQRTFRRPAAPATAQARFQAAALRANNLAGLTLRQQAVTIRELMPSPEGRKQLLTAPNALAELAKTPEGRRVLLTTDAGRKQLLLSDEGRLMLLRTSEGQQTLAEDSFNNASATSANSLQVRQDASTLDGRQKLAQSLVFGMTIVGADEYGDVLAWPTRANAPYWLQDQYNPSRQPQIDN